MALLRGSSGTRLRATSPLGSALMRTALSSFMWDAVAGPPLPAPVGAGTVEGFVGRIRMRGDDTLWIAAFEGSKLGQVWKIGPLGTYSEGYQSTFVSVVGREVVVTDFRTNVHVYDLSSGHELRSIKLTDRAKSMCPAVDGKPLVWIEVADEKNVLVDVDAGRVTAAASRPTWCPDGRALSNDCRGWLRRGPQRIECRGPELAPKVSGVEATNVVEEGDVAVALGRKHPGTAVPLAVGFDPKTKTVHWQKPAASGDPASVAEASTTMDALADGRFVTPYQLTSRGWHLTALDARSGQRLWDVPLQPLIGADEPQGFTLSGSRVYVLRSASVEVYDAKSGTLVDVVGAG